MKELLVATGGTGFIGKESVNSLIGHYRKIILLVRNSSNTKAKEMFSHLKNVEIVSADIISGQIDTEELLLKTKDLRCDFLHLAAAYDFSMDYRDLYLANIIGTQNILEWIDRYLKVDHLYYTSTIAVSGNFQGRFLESDFDLGQQLENDYAKTKYQAERIVREHYLKVSYALTILRPGIVIGNSKTGEFIKWDGPYYFIKLLGELTRNSLVKKSLNSLMLIPMPYDPLARLPLVPIDLLVDTFSLVLQKVSSKKELNCYHVSGSEEGTLVTEMLKSALNSFSLKVKLIPVKKNSLIPALLKKGFSIPESLWGYLFQRTIYDQTTLKRDFPQNSFTPFHTYSEKMLNEAKRKLAL